MSGRLFIIATPIGNLGDLTLRARQVLESVDVVLAEDTRVSIKLLNHLGVKKRLLSCHDYNERQRLELLSELAADDAQVALVSDAGTPLVSDPGFQVLRKAIELGMDVVPVPGASAFLLALVGSGLPCERFVFEGFLPDKKGERLRRLTELRGDQRTMIFYVAPHDLARTLSSMVDIFGDRQACLARELTKRFEEFVRGRLSEVEREIQNRSVLGECVLVVAGAESGPATLVDEAVIVEELRLRLSKGARLKDLAAEIALKYGWPKSNVYKLGVDLKTD